MADQQSLEDILGPAGNESQTDNPSLDAILGPSANAPINAAPSPKNIIQRTGEDVAQRLNNLQNIQANVDAGKISAPSGFIQRMGEVAGAGFGDPTMEMAKSAGEYIPDAIKNWGSGVAQRAGQMVPESYSGAVNKSLSAMPQFQQAHPEISGDIGAALNVAGILPTAEGIQGVGNFAKNGIKAFDKSGIDDFTRSGLSGLNDRKPVAAGSTSVKSSMFDEPEQQAANFWQNRATPDQARHVAGIKYDIADQAGGALSPDKRNQFIDAAQGANKGADGKIVPPSPLAQKILDNLSETRGQPLTLRGAQNIEEGINSNIEYQPNGQLTKDSVQLLKIKKALRNTIDSATPQDMTGGPDGWQAWQDGKKAYAASGILTDINNMINKSTYADQPAAQLKRNIARWGNKSSTLGSLSVDEMDLVKDSIKNNFADDMLRTGSSRLLPIAGAAMGITGHGPIGSMVAGAIGKVSRGAAYARQLDKMGAFADAIGERLPSIDSINVSAPKQSAMLALPSPEMVGPAGMTPEQLAHSTAKINAMPRTSTPYSGGPIVPQYGAPPPGDLGYGGLGGENVITPSPEEPLDLSKSFFKHKATGGPVTKGKIGFKLKKKDK